MNMETGNSMHGRKVGMPPGTLVAVGEQRVDRTTVRLMQYSADAVTERDIDDPKACRALLAEDSVSWINVTGLHDITPLTELGQAFGIQPLVLEDIVTTGQRPKMEDRDDYVFLVLRMLYRGDKEGEIRSEQVSMVLGQGWLLTFQEVDGDVFDLIRRRIRTGGGRIRTQGADYLFYALLDAIVDHYFVVLDELGLAVETLQDSLIDSHAPRTVVKIHRLKRDMIYLRRHLAPVREAVAGLLRSECPLLHAGLAPYLRDLYEHMIQVLDIAEGLREMVSSSLEIYMTVVSNRMNEVMKILTLISTIFIPLTFVAGIYGMNFERMPELTWRYGYPGVLGLMALVGVAMFIAFRRRKWL